MTKTRINRLAKADLLRPEIEKLCKIHGIASQVDENKVWQFTFRSVKLVWSPMNNRFYLSGEGYWKHLDRFKWLRSKQADWILDGLRELAGSRQYKNAPVCSGV